MVEPRLRKPRTIRREKEGLMNFDELWRKNLVPEHSPVCRNDEQEEVPSQGFTSEWPNELDLTAEDCTFLWQVGIKT